MELRARGWLERLRDGSEVVRIRVTVRVRVVRVRVGVGARVRVAVRVRVGLRGRVDTSSIGLRWCGLSTAVTGRRSLASAAAHA